jgi:histidine ammonia-lyase
MSKKALLSLRSLPKKVTLDGSIVSPEDVAAVALFGAKVNLSAKAKTDIRQSRQRLEHLLGQETPIYGVTTGVGDLYRERVSSKEAKKLSRNIIYSHACGVGDPLEKEKVRALIFCSIVQFTKGYSGVTLKLVESLVSLLNNSVTPLIPGKGTLDYSLIHLSHVGLTLLGEGKAFYRGQLLSSKEALRRAKLSPIELQEKEGLSLISGTTSMTGFASLAIERAFRLGKLADICGAFTYEALNGNIEALDSRIHRARPHQGQIQAAKNLKRLLKGSRLIASGSKNKLLQNAASVRAIPQVHGACRDRFLQCYETIKTEINSATDNPLIVKGKHGPEALSGFNPHGEALALSAETLALASAELATLAERRIARMTTHYLSGLPPFLVKEFGRNSGLMIPQYVAAALVSESKLDCTPVVGQGISTTANQEDHVSMGTLAASKAISVIQNSEVVFGIELMTAAQALEFQDRKKLGVVGSFLYKKIRNIVAPLIEDRILQPDIEAMISFVQKGDWVYEIEKKWGEL